MKGFTKLNRKTKKFKSAASNFKYTDKIVTQANETVIYHGNGNNIHPANWKSEWFEDSTSASKYIEGIKNGYRR